MMHGKVILKCHMNPYVLHGHSIFRTCPNGHAQLQLDRWLLFRCNVLDYVFPFPLFVFRGAKNAKQNNTVLDSYVRRSTRSNVVLILVHPSSFTHAYQTSNQHLVLVWISTVSPRWKSHRVLLHCPQSLLACTGGFCIGAGVLVANSNCQNTFAYV